MGEVLFVCMGVHVCTGMRVNKRVSYILGKCPAPKPLCPEAQFKGTERLSNSDNIFIFYSMYRYYYCYYYYLSSTGN